MRKNLLLLLLLLPSSAWAGFLELSALGSYRKSSVNDDNFSETRSFTGSIAWYFLEQSAIELSYTKGFVKTQSQELNGVVLEPVTSITNFTMYGADIVFSFAPRDAFFRPYIKGGISYLEKSLETESGGVIFTAEQDGQFVTGGAGFKLSITKTFAIKIGYDVWHGPLQAEEDEDETTDNALRGGITWLF